MNLENENSDTSELSSTQEVDTNELSYILITDLESASVAEWEASINLSSEYPSAGAQVESLARHGANLTNKDWEGMFDYEYRYTNTDQSAGTIIEPQGFDIILGNNMAQASAPSTSGNMVTLSGMGIDDYSTGNKS